MSTVTAAAVGGSVSARVQRLWIPMRLPGLNEIIDAAKGMKGRGLLYAKMKAKLTNDIALLAKAAGLRPVQRGRFVFTWHEANRQRNPDNVAAGKKFILDALVAAKVLANDGWGEIAGWEDHFTVSPRPGVMVVIEETAPSLFGAPG